MKIADKALGDKHARRSSSQVKASMMLDMLISVENKRQDLENDDEEDEERAGGNSKG